MSKILSYVVARDYGFAPNPFYGYCTLGTCISPVRRAAQIGDLVIGSGTKTRGLEGRLVYVMRVTEKITFDEYWADPRFVSKKPLLNGSRKQQYGDNIYHSVSGVWHQADSHHSLPGGNVNLLNLESDTKVNQVLVSDHYTYWGNSGPVVPAHLRDWGGVDVVRQSIGHRHNFPLELVAAFEAWVDPLLGLGVQGRPSSW